MIVTLKKTGMSNREHVDSTFPVLAKALPSSQLITISGKQLRLAGLKETVVGAPILPHKNYITGISNVEEVRYVSFNRTLLPMVSDKVKMHVRMQYLGVDSKGFVMLRPSDVVRAGVSKGLAELFTQDDTGYIHVSVRYLRFD